MTDQPTPETEPEDTCRPVDIDGETIRVRGAGEMSDESREALGEVISAAKAKFTADAPEMVGALQNRLRLAHQARRAKAHQLDDIRRALCDIGFMDDDDPYSHADLADVIRQNGRAMVDGQAACIHPDGYDGECPCPSSCGCCRVVAAQQEQAAPVDWQATVRARERELKQVGEARHQAEAALARVRALGERWRYTSDRKHTALPELLAALDGPQPAAHDDGPSVAEATADDKRWFGGEKAGE